jgi:hypothetical protein
MLVIPATWEMEVKRLGMMVPACESSYVRDKCRRITVEGQPGQKCKILSKIQLVQKRV